MKVLTLLAFAGIIVFFATVHSPFLYDDAHVIEDNPYIKDLSKFQQTVGIQNIFNRSVLLLTFSLNHEVGKLDVFGYHLFNITLHICVGILIYFIVAELLILERSFIKPSYQKLPIIASLIHIFNPVGIQSVTYISSRSSLLATLLYLLSFYFLIRLDKEKNYIKNLKYIGYSSIAFILFLLGLGAKEIVITLPIIAVFYFWMRSPEKKIKKFLPELVLLLLPLLGYLLYRYVEMGGLIIIKTDPSTYLIDRGLYFLTQIKVIISYYLLKLFLPFNLNFEPDVRLISSFYAWQWVLAFLTMAVIISMVFFQKSILLKGAFFWSIVTILPTSSIIPLKQFAIEHRTYLPGIGISIGISILFLRAMSVSRIIYFGLPTLLVIFGLLAINRSLDYRNEIILWEDTVKKSPYKSMVHNNLGTAYLSKERLKEAEKSFEFSLALSPSSTAPYINLGHIHARKEEWEQARVKFDLALKLGSNRSQVFYNSGLMRMRLDKPQEALPFLLKAVDIKSHRPRYHYELGNAFRRLKKNDLALKAYRRVLEITPNHIEAQNNIGTIFWNLKALDKAEIEFKKALKMNGKKIIIHKNLANVYLAKKNFPKAILYLKLVLSESPGDKRSRNLLHIAEVIEQSEIK